MESFVLTIIGTDRTGLVEALARVVADHGGNWERSHMTELAGMLAGMALVHVPAERSEDFRQALDPLRELGLMDVTLHAAAAAALPEDAPTLVLEVYGADRAGIVHEVSSLLRQLGVGIADLRTWTESAAMAGTPMFRAAAVVHLPEGVTKQSLQAAMEDLSEDLMVDLTEQ